eukprot:scpid104989/ scgid5056/ UPF0672 protein C3orf58 homolog
MLLYIVVLLDTLRHGIRLFDFQAFPSSDGWPFPRYYGACGRMIFVEDSGAEMGDYMDAPWTVRVRVAKALVDTTIKLTDNAEQWIFHLLDVEEDNFAVHYNSTLDRYVVTLIDLEHMIIVNKNDPGKLRLEERKEKRSRPVHSAGKFEQSCFKLKQGKQWGTSYRVHQLNQVFEQSKQTCTR